jgi:hypothetical protein
MGNLKYHPTLNTIFNVVGSLSLTKGFKPCDSLPQSPSSSLLYDVLICLDFSTLHNMVVHLKGYWVVVVVRFGWFYMIKAEVLASLHAHIKDCDYDL